MLILLADEDWRIRNVATTTLVSLGDTAAAAVARHAEHENIGVRAAAIQVLNALGD